ncbi:hypothetical protein GCM10025876_14020 [Demequina litorisediminis]|uniref:Uncharacterized protein n=1 Tax=Demequina litorisediminis TaxID=1849022 RepID=A0ABQ6IBH4_9MICO|nr:hypothetical protein GCM10025876_14020 [Demequina litorisediminis]
MLEGVAADLALETAELRANEGQVGAHERVEAIDGGHALAAGEDPPAVTRDDIEADDVVAGLAVGHRVGSAGVITDEAAEGRPIGRRGVRAKAQPVRRGRLL